jgi:hypothetical protein
MTFPFSHGYRGDHCRPLELNYGAESKFRPALRVGGMYTLLRIVAFEDFHCVIVRDDLHRRFAFSISSEACGATFKRLLEVQER